MKRSYCDKLTYSGNMPYFVKEKLYKVYFGSEGHRIERTFRQKRHALAFIAELNRFITAKVHELNLIYIDVFAMYRRNWFYIKGDGYNEKIQAIERTFELLINRSHWENGNVFVFTHLNTIAFYLKDLMQKCLAISDRRNAFSESADIRAMYQRIVHVNNTIDEFVFPEKIQAEESRAKLAVI